MPVRPYAFSVGLRQWQEASDNKLLATDLTGNVEEIGAIAEETASVLSAFVATSRDALDDPDFTARAQEFIAAVDRKGHDKVSVGSIGRAQPAAQWRTPLPSMGFAHYVLMFVWGYEHLAKACGISEYDLSLAKFDLDVMGRR